MLNSVNQTTRNLWQVLAQTFGAASMSAVYADFKQVIGIKLSGGNPVPEIERIGILLEHLMTNTFIIPTALQAMIPLAALPPKRRRQNKRDVLTSKQSTPTSPHQ